MGFPMECLLFRLLINYNSYENFFEIQFADRGIMPVAAR